MVYYNLLTIHAKVERKLELRLTLNCVYNSKLAVLFGFYCEIDINVLSIEIVFKKLYIGDSFYSIQRQIACFLFFLNLYFMS